MNKTFKLLPPMMPNYIAYEVPARPRQEGFNPDANRIDIKDMTDEEAEEYGELMKQAFIEHHKNRKAKAN